MALSQGKIAWRIHQTPSRGYVLAGVQVIAESVIHIDRFRSARLCQVTCEVPDRRNLMLLPSRRLDVNVRKLIQEIPLNPVRHRSGLQENPIIKESLRGQE
jgi:hypothetical protein